MPNGLFVRLFTFLAWCLIVAAALGLLIVLAIGLSEPQGNDDMLKPPTPATHGPNPARPIKLVRA